MARPIERTATGTIAETTSSGLGFGMVGAVLGAAATVALFAVGFAAIAGLAVGALSGAPLTGAALALGLGEATTFTSVVGGIAGFAGGVTGLFSAPVGAMIGGGAGAAAGIASKTQTIQAQKAAAQTVRRGHGAAIQEQISEVRAQAAEEYTKMGYAQGVQDGQVAVMQHLQEAAMQQQQQQQMAVAEPEQDITQKASFADKILNERGGHAKAHGSHAEKALASKEQAGEQALGA